MTEQKQQIKVQKAYFLEEISKATGIPVNEIEKMDMHDIEDRLNLLDCDPRPKSLYKFISRYVYARRQKKIDKILDEYINRMK